MTDYSDILDRLGRLETLTRHLEARSLSPDDLQFVQGMIERERETLIVRRRFAEMGGMLKLFAGWFVAMAAAWMLFKDAARAILEGLIS